MTAVDGARYRHTNLVASDWRRLARFYTEVFGCEALSPERDLQGSWLDEATGLHSARLEGIHLRLPGHGPGGPTLEIFSYRESVTRPEAMPNETGYGHVAFEVDDVAAALDAVVEHGGRALGRVTRTHIAEAGDLEIVYARDPEANVIELQAWH